MTAYPMLNTERARIVNEAVAVACGMTGNECKHPNDTLRWGIAMLRLSTRRLHVGRWP